MDVEGVVNEEVDGDRDVCGEVCGKVTTWSVECKAGRSGSRATGAPTQGCGLLPGAQ